MVILPLRVVAQLDSLIMGGVLEGSWVSMPVPTLPEVPLL